MKDKRYYMSHFSKLNPAKMVAQAVEHLSPRLKEVVALRFGLYDGKRKTLEAIGQKYHITRERVRQIQNDAFRQMRRAEVVGKIKPLFEVLDEHLKLHGGVRKESTLLERDLVEYGADSLNQPQQKAAVYFALSFADPFERHLEDTHWHTFWAHQKSAPALVKKVTDGVIDHFRTIKHPVLEDEAREIVAKSLGKNAGFANKVPEQVVSAWMGLMRPLGKNIYGEYGLREWPEIVPTGMRDKAFLVMQKLGRPLHFSEVAQTINRAKFDDREAHPQTVHNELIKDKRFVLIGRGTYALASWGYQPGTVKEVLSRILKKNGKPLTKEDIFKEISAQRIVKQNTVLLNLQNKSLFRRTADGRYTLA